MVNFRKFVISSGLEIFGGRDSDNNDKLVWDAKPNDVMLHTSAPGSPFVNVGDSAGKIDEKEVVIDMNHPMAGKVLVFWIEVVGIGSD